MVVRAEGNAVGEADLAIEHAEHLHGYRIDLIHTAVPVEVHITVDEGLAVDEILGGHSGVGHVEQSVRTKAEVIRKQKAHRAFALHAPDLVSALVDADQRPEAGFRDPDPAVAIGR